MTTAAFDSRTPGLVSLAVLGFLGLTLAAALPEQPLREGRRGPEQPRSDGDSDGRSALAAAAKKLAGAPSYRWTTTVTMGDAGATDGSGAVSGETERDGYTRVAMPSGAGRLEFVTRDGKAAVLREGSWQTLDAGVASGARRSAAGPARSFDPALVSNFRLPPVRAEELIGKASSFRHADGTVTATLTPEASAAVLNAEIAANFRQGRRGRGQADAAIKDPRGSVTFRVQGGVLTEFTLALSGTRQLFDNEIALDRTLTTKFSDLGLTKVDVPEDAREIIEALRAGRAPSVFVPEPGFKKLFDGRSLAGWEGRPGFWSVEDGAITGRTTKEKPLKGNTFLFARSGDKRLIVDDFELRLSYRITADNGAGFANSGIQYRSRERGDFVAAGYQADFEAGPTFSGILYDEAGGAGGRRIMALRGEKVTWASGGRKEVMGRLGTSAEIQARIKKDDWNEYIVIARGNRIQHFINGAPTVDVVDDDPRRLDSGILALQLHAGQPMTVRFKDIRIKSLRSAADSAAGNLRVAKGFKLDQIYMVPKATQGSWVALCVDPKGRLIAADQNGKLYRMTLPAPGSNAAVEPEALGVDLAGAHGLLCAFDSLYVMVNERGTHGLYRVRDSDGDDRFDKVTLLRAIRGGGEHGMHSIIVSPDGKGLYVVCGNSTELTKVDRSRVPLVWSEDNLATRIPTGFMDNSLAPQGWIARTDPDGKEWELIAAGMRNPFDIAFDRDGELFTFDADMEWDIGEPWYRPTRVNHIISGAEFGFRNGSGKWPAYYIDSFGSVADIGPGSPTGITFGYGAKFPAKYRDALFISDWSFGKLRAVHLRPEGASCTAEVEEFISGQPLPVTDVVINPKDGAMYFAVGGRGAQSALYRVTYTGGDLTNDSPPAKVARPQSDLRHKLEGYHGHRDAKAVEACWPYLGDPDRAIRFAARVAIEWQDPAQWRQKALSEPDPRKAIAALVALARVSGRDALHRKPSDPEPSPVLRDRLLTALDAIDWSRLSRSDRVDLLRAYTLTFTRLGRPDDEACRRLDAKFDSLFPARDVSADFLLAELLAYLQAPTAAAKIVAAMREAPTQEEQIHYALVLRGLKEGWTPPLREEYFRWFVTKGAAYRGGNTFANALRTIKSQALRTLTDDERIALKPILESRPTQRSPRDLLAARTPVKEWTVADLVPVVERGLTGRLDPERGRRLYGAVACASCHRFGADGGGVGPDLTAVAGRFGVRDLLEAIVEPSKVVSDQYAAISIAMKDGRSITGRVGNLSGDSLSVIEDMFDPGQATDVRRADIEEMKPSDVSLMPMGLLNTLTEDEINDLVGFLLTRGDSQKEPSRP
jgi:putative heme-binding domain-containing protein